MAQAGSPLRFHGTSKRQQQIPFGNDRKGDHQGAESERFVSEFVANCAWQSNVL